MGKKRKKGVTFGATVNVLAGMKSFTADKVFVLVAVFIGVAESHFRKRSSTAWVMKYILNHTLYVTRENRGN